jgi:RHS repeat-associated protein
MRGLTGKVRWVPTDTTTASYSALGHLASTTSAIFGDTTNTPTFRGNERFEHDALGNLVNDTAAQSVKQSNGRRETQVKRRAGYAAGTGRLSWTDNTVTQYVTGGLSVPRTITDRSEFQYDASGNLEFSTQRYGSDGSCSSRNKADADCEDRVSFYAADGSLRAAEYRTRMGEDDGNYWRDAFEEYRYDALGRRVWVRSQVECPTATPTSGWPLIPCESVIRRTVWDGDAELWEIQMPGHNESLYLENDTLALPVAKYNPWVSDGKEPSVETLPGIMPPTWENYARFDPNPRYGRVAYTHGLGVDQPLSLVRIGLNRHFPDDPYTSVRDSQSVSFAPFAAMPLADSRGHVDGALYAGGRTSHCQTFNGTERCTRVVGGQAWSAYGQEDPSVLEWHGTLLTGKRDATGTLFRRARYYDPQTGRFTQEDPIGLAGGLNLYGYAGGDPVNLSDPTGYFWVPALALGGAVVGAAAYWYTTPTSQQTAGGYARWALGGAAIGATAGFGIKVASGAFAAKPVFGIGTAVTVNASGTAVGVAASAQAAGSAVVASTPVVASAVPKLSGLAQQFGTTSQELISRGLNTATKYVDHANSGNVNALFARLDGAPGWIRVTFDPTNTRVISAGLMRANNVANHIANGRFTPY